MASSLARRRRAVVAVMTVPAKRGAWAVALMARWAAGPERPPPTSRSSWRPETVPVTARTVSMSMRSWMPPPLREAYPSAAKAVRRYPYWTARATRPFGLRAMCQASVRLLPALDVCRGPPERFCLAGPGAGVSRCWRRVVWRFLVLYVTHVISLEVVLATSLYDDPAAGRCSDARAGLD